MKRGSYYTVVAVVALFCPALPCRAQCPYAIQWSHCFGGSGDDWASSSRLTLDGGYVMAGYTYSTDGNVTGNHGGADAWVVKVDANGALQWEQCYGGSEYDIGRDIQLTADSGFILLCYTGSTDGEVTGNHGSGDWWIVKLSSTGTMQWKECIGGSDDDYPQSIIQTTEGGYLVSGDAKSYDGDFADSTADSAASGNFWIVKLSAAGSIEWKKRIGPVGGDAGMQTGIMSLQTNDGGYISAFTSDTVLVTAYRAEVGQHYRVMKMDSIGKTQWESYFGGNGIDETETILQTRDGGYIITGGTTSDAGDITFNHGGYDAWLVKINSVGTLQWQKCYGGSGDDNADDVIQLSDGSYVFSGTTSSNDGDVSGNHGSGDGWLVHIDSAGNLLWSKCFGGTQLEGFTKVHQTSDGNFMLGSGSSSNDDDVSGNHGGGDFWLVKLYISGPLTGAPVAFDSVAAGGCKLDTVLLINASITPDTLSKMTFSGEYAADFSVDSILIKALAPGDTETVLVRFCPTHPGVDESASALVIYQAGGKDTLVIAVTGYAERSVDARETNGGVPNAFTLTVAPDIVQEQTAISFTLPAAQRVSLGVYDVLGRQVWNAHEIMDAGAHVMQYDCSGIPAGVYFIRLQTAAGVASKQFIVVR